MRLTPRGIPGRATAKARPSTSSAKTWTARVLVLAMWPIAWWLTRASTSGWVDLGSHPWSADAAIALGIGSLGAVAACYLALISLPLMVGAALRHSPTPAWLHACTPQLWRRVIATAVGGVLSVSMATASVAAPLSEPDETRHMSVTSAGWVTSAPLTTARGGHQLDGYAGTAQSPAPHRGAHTSDAALRAHANYRSGDALATGSTVTVRRGDSLWLICADLLPASATQTDIAHAWPLLYQANRDIIGANPSLIYAGQQLELPVELRS